MAWLGFSLPAVGFLLGQARPITVSGYDLLIAGPGSYRSTPIVAVALIPALGALAILLTGLWALPRAPWRPFVGIVPMLLGMAGLVSLGVLLTIARAEPERLLRELGLQGELPSLLSAALVRVEPASGYALSVVGFILLLMGGAVDIVIQARARLQGL